MIKRILYFGTPAYLSTKNEQLVISKRNDEEVEVSTAPIEDLGVVILDHPQITLTQGLAAKLMANNVAVVTCDHTHHPVGLFLPLDGATVQGERFRAQIESSLPLKKQLWAQTVACKIQNQAYVLSLTDAKTENMQKWAKSVTSGDPKNVEGRAAAYYWANLFRHRFDTKFLRDRFGEPPNNMLNYGYAIIRAMVARGLVGSGLLPTLGIHHHNKYNAYCLADDIMEPYRPFVDRLVLELMANGEDIEELSPSIKKQMFQLSTVDVRIGQVIRPLMIAISHTTASVARCFLGEQRKIEFPSFPDANETP